MWRSRSSRVGLCVLALALGEACASTGATPRPFPSPRTTSPANTPSLDGQQTVATALGLLGVPYREGGSDLRGFDCSGFTQFVFAKQGLALPREVRDQFARGRRVKPGQVQPGDLIFFRTTTRGPSHVGIAIDGERFVHAPSSTGVVRIERVGASYWAARLIGVRRLSGS